MVNIIEDNVNNKINKAKLKWSCSSHPKGTALCILLLKPLEC